MDWLRKNILSYKRRLKGSTTNVKGNDRLSGLTRSMFTGVPHVFVGMVP